MKVQATRVVVQILSAEPAEVCIILMFLEFILNGSATDFGSERKGASRGSHQGNTEIATEP